MIKNSKGQELVKAISQTFDNVTVNVKGNSETGDYERVSFNVHKINTEELIDLAYMTTNAEAAVELKRSGTGITVIFN